MSTPKQMSDVDQELNDPEIAAAIEAYHNAIASGDEENKDRCREAVMILLHKHRHPPLKEVGIEIPKLFTPFD